VKRADLVVLVLDASSPSPGTAGEGWGEGLTVINKVDRPAGWDWSTHAGIQTVATSGQGVDRLRDAIRRHFGCLDVPEDRLRIWTPRQRDIIERALTNPETLREL
jgi:tRNA U34 5-carboxymethylaminomethyl modifying GTPase MnmE/TrmE